jgi:hypothetical protein
MLRYSLISVLMVVAATSTGAANPEIRPGQYVLEGDSGTLTIRKDERNRLTFEIESIGGNCHTCSVSGAISGTIGYGDSWAGDGRGSKCEISFVPDGTAIVVRPITQEGCRAYCGMRAGFDGTYLVHPVACTSVGRKKLRDRFLRLYSTRQFLPARKTLQSLLAQCSKFMNWIEVDQVRNDLALAQYHSGDFQQCLTTLNDTLAASAKDAEDLKSGNGNIYLPPCDFDNYIGVAKATWFNKALCSKAMRQKDGIR